jgi:nitrogen fixation/metabolism regulation signal transduction histidine kinase
LVRGPESVASPVVGALASRFGLDRVEMLSDSGATLAAFGAEPGTPGTAVLVERRRVPAEGETLTLVAARLLGPPFVDGVAAVTSGKARLGAPGDPSCAQTRVEVAVTDAAVLCVGVVPADARELRLDLLRSFAGVAPVAFLAALAVGLVLAGRIVRPVRELAVRAESISAQHSGPMTLLKETDETRRMTIAFDQMLDSLEASERKRLAAERVAAWEEIAKRLAHEIKNPLSPIRLAVENLRRTRERSPAAFDEAFAVETQTILEEVASLRALVDEFAQFARLPRPNVAACDPRAIVEHALALFAARIGSMRVAVSVELPSDLPPLRADSEQVGRLLKNVLGNALDAMEEAPERALNVTVRREGERMVFAVRDTGRGFDADSLRRVFTPYFTTRADRGGTGLGMAIARRIAVEHGGSLDAYGAPGRGATITLTLPITGPPQEGA